MENYNEGTPATTGSQTPPAPAGGGWPPMPGYYNMMMPAWSPGMQQMMPPMAAGGSVPAWQGVPPMQPPMQMMPAWSPGMQPPAQAMPPPSQAMTPPSQGTPGGDVYRPTFEFSTGSSHTSTPADAQLTQDASFSLEDLDFDMNEVPETLFQSQGVGRGRSAPKKKGKAKKVGESSQPVEDSRVRRKWTDAENVALAKAWVSVCDDPLVSNNQRIVNLWAKIAAAYRAFCPEGRPRTGEECRKCWDRIRSAVSRFSGLYANALRMQTSGQTEEDCRRIAERAFPDPPKYHEFTYWNCYVVLNESEKFRAGVDAGWPKKQRLNYTGDYSGSSGGSHDLPETAQEVPTPRSFGRRPRPVGQRWAQRDARGGTPSNQEVQSPSPLGRSNEELKFFARQQTRTQMAKTLAEFQAAVDPEVKTYLRVLLQSMREELEGLQRDTGGSSRGVGGDGGEDGDDDEEGLGDDGGEDGGEE